MQIHATAVAVGNDGLLLRGPPGSGKSDLALRLIDGGALLVADDRVDLSLEAGELMASAPAALAGLLEVRGVGILRLPARPSVRVSALVDLVAFPDIERLPDACWETILGRVVRRFLLAAFEASAAAKLRALLRYSSLSPDRSDPLSPG